MSFFQNILAKKGTYYAFVCGALKWVLVTYINNAELSWQNFFETFGNEKVEVANLQKL